MGIKTGSRTYRSDSEKLRIIQEVRSGKLSKEAAQRKYGIKGHSAITNWMRSFRRKESLKASNFMSELNQEKEDAEDLSARVKELEEALRLAEIKSEAYSKMIDLAEEKFSLKIRKKLSTKQSKP